MTVITTTGTKTEVTGSMAAIAIDSGLRPPTPRAFPLDRAGIEALIGGAAA